MTPAQKEILGELYEALETNDRRDTRREGRNSIEYGARPKTVDAYWEGCTNIIYQPRDPTKAMG